MNEYILIISNKEDITTDLVIKRLHQRSIPFLRFNTENYPLHTKAEIEIKQEFAQARIFGNKISLSNESIKSIWYRRPIAPDISSRNLIQEDNEFAVRESLAFLQNTWAFLTEARWINNPFFLVKAEQKAFQLKIAMESGFLIPKTFISSVYESIHSFAEGCQNGFIVKPLSHGALGNNDDKAIFTNELDISSIKDYKSSIELSPFIIQEKINKESDVRVTVFSDKIFAHRITLNTDHPKNVDWRVYKPGELLYDSIMPPDRIVNSIKQFMSKINITYGAFDFCITPNDEWYFIEVNPSGQFAWLELATGDKLIDALIDTLIE